MRYVNFKEEILECKEYSNIARPLLQQGDRIHKFKIKTFDSLYISENDIIYLKSYANILAIYSPFFDDWLYQTSHGIKTQHFLITLKNDTDFFHGECADTGDVYQLKYLKRS